MRLITKITVLLFTIIVALFVVDSVNAQTSLTVGTHGATKIRIQDDSLKTTSDPYYLPIAANADIDTSKEFTLRNIARVCFQFYRNDADTGDVTFYFQQKVIDFADSSLVVKNVTWINSDTLWWAVATGRKSVMWEPTFYPTEKGRIVAKHTDGGGAVVIYGAGLLQE